MSALGDMISFEMDEAKKTEYKRGYEDGVNASRDGMQDTVTPDDDPHSDILVDEPANWDFGETTFRGKFISDEALAKREKAVRDGVLDELKQITSEMFAIPSKKSRVSGLGYKHDICIAIESLRDPAAWE